MVMLHPETEPLDFYWDPSGSVVAGTKTSVLGPGFHAYVYDLMVAVGKSCGLEWDWSGDEAGYAESQDFADLQRQMAAFLSNLAAAFLENAGDGALQVNMPLFAPVPRAGAFSFTPLGPRSREWWEAARVGGVEAADFYVWWSRERDAAYYRQLGRMFLWSVVPWHPPADESEESVMKLAIECFERAAELDPASGDPPAEVAELRALLEHDEDAPAPDPRPDGIGYRRRAVPLPLPGGWTIELPAYWYQALHDEGTVQWYGYNDKSVHASTFVAEHKGRPEPADRIARTIDENRPADAQVLNFRDGRRIGRAWIAPVEEDGEQGIVLRGCMAIPGQGAHVTIWFEDPADLDWAAMAFRSLTCPDAEPD